MPFRGEEFTLSAANWQDRPRILSAWPGRSYAVTEDDGRIGSVCIYEASDRDAIREHGQRIGAPSEEISPVRGTAVKRADPEPVAAV